jgi:uncharacterized protein YsxB (DUF464 family)
MTSIYKIEEHAKQKTSMKQAICSAFCAVHAGFLSGLFFGHEG